MFFLVKSYIVTYNIITNTSTIERRGKEKASLHVSHR